MFSYHGGRCCRRIGAGRLVVGLRELEVRGRNSTRILRLCVWGISCGAGWDFGGGRVAQSQALWLELGGMRLRGPSSQLPRFSASRLVAPCKFPSCLLHAPVADLHPRSSPNLARHFKFKLRPRLEETASRQSEELCHPNHFLNPKESASAVFNRQDVGPKQAGQDGESTFRDPVSATPVSATISQALLT